MNSSFRAIAVGDFDLPAELIELDNEILYRRATSKNSLISNHFNGRQLVVKTHFSTLNYKDALGVTAQKRVISRAPLVLGVDLAAEILDVNSNSRQIAFKKGDLVVAGGLGFGEHFNGGLSEMTALKMSTCFKLPELGDLHDLKKAMFLGTAGLTAMLCVNEVTASASNSIKRKSAYPVAVTGATGGVGLLSIHLLKNLGFKVAAITNLNSEKEIILGRYGVDEVIDVNEYITKKRTLKSQRFLGAVDAVGGEVLAELLKDTAYYGCIASTGMVMSDMFTTSLYPFIIRGVKLVGVETIKTPIRLRRAAFRKLFELVDFNLLAESIVEIGLSSVINYAKRLVDNSVTGRILVNCQT